MSKQPNVISLSEWLKKNPEFEDIENETKEKCPECCGEGWIECSKCGHEEECEDCDGRGFITKNPADSAYYKQVARDREDWLKYVVNG